jgi:hypothetical protein
MNGLKMRRPTPALVIGMIALFVALGGTAGAVVTAAVPLAKRALVADNAKKVGGLTAAQVGSAAAQAALRESPAGPRPASTAAGLTVVKTGTASLGPNGGGDFTVACDSGQKVMGGGFTSNTGVIAFDSYPQSDTTWAFFLANLSESTAANITLYATCLK